jgi:hypothetical protein
MELRIIAFLQIPLIIPRQFFSEFESLFEETINKIYRDKTVRHEDFKKHGWGKNTKQEIPDNPNYYMKNEYRYQDECFYTIIYINPRDYIKVKKLLEKFPAIKKPSLKKFRIKL